MLAIKSVKCPRCFCFTVIIGYASYKLNKNHYCSIILNHIWVHFFFSIRKRCDSSCILIEFLEKYVPVQQWLVIYRTWLPLVGRHLKALTDQLPSQDQHEVKLLGELDLLNLYESLCKSDFTDGWIYGSSGQNNWIFFALFQIRSDILTKILSLYEISNLS